MVRQKSGEIMSSPTPSIDSLNSGAAVGSLCGLEQNDHCSVDLLVDKTTSSSSSTSSSSGFGSSPLGSIFTSCTKCPVCGGTYNNPKVLQCFHTFCQHCLEKIQDHRDKLTCPQCHADTQLGASGVSGLLSDFGVSGLIETAVAGSMDFQSTSCTSCKSRDSSAVARCMTCASFLCPGCVSAHKYMLCFDGHHVTTLGEITSKEGSRHEIQELEGINRLVQEGKSKAQEIRNNLKNIETSSGRLSLHYNKSLNDINETFQFFNSILEDRKMELLRELESQYSFKQVAMSVYSQKAQETVDKLYQVTDFIERLMKYSSNGEVLLFKRPIEQKFSSLLSTGPVEVNADEICEIKFVTNYQAIQTCVKSNFGYIKPRSEDNSSIMAVGSGCKQPPISRPIGSTSLTLSNGMNGGGSLGFSSLMSTTASSSNGLTNGLTQTMATMANPSRNGAVSPTHHMINGIQGSHSQSNSMKGYILDRQSTQPYLSGLSSPLPPICSNSSLNQVGSSNNNLFESNGMMSKHFSSPTSLGPLLSDLGSLGSSTTSNGMSSYEKWSNGSDKPYTNGSSVDSQSQFGFSNGSPVGSQLGSTGESIMDLSNKLMSQNVFPPKSQVKRHKMVYHCKFGEFGVLEGQFTEPSGVAVNAQNDIIVADTNNHRIQIFDKEGRFKFQFGECGKRDGQLLYPNRVAVMKNSGDIVVTERSPTHQVQIYNQYGQFVRKFGANILQHPRGVCVDNKGRIIVVECKVMRVIIFDQMGNILNKFGCSKHLEFPNGVVVNDRQEIFISDNRAHCVKVFNYDGVYIRQIGGEGITNYPIGVGINAEGEVTIADNHNNFNLTVFSQDGTLLSALESKVKHAQCFDVSLMDDGSVVLASKDYRLYIYRYLQLPQIGI